jgi:hypothetical protein
MIMKNSVLAVITAPENGKAVAIGAAVGISVVCGFAAFKIAALGVAGKVAVATVIAGCAGYATHKAIESGQLTSMMNGFQAEMSNLKS